MQNVTIGTHSPAQSDASSQSSRLTEQNPANPTTPKAVGFNEHLDYFDRNADDHISLDEAFVGLKNLGLGYLLAAPAALAINFGLAGLGILEGRPVNPLSLPLPRTGFVRHPDTNLVDENGSFNNARLDAVFSQYGKEFNGEALTIPELAKMVVGRLLKDTNTLGEVLALPAGAAGVAGEWGLLFWIAASKRDAKPVLEKEAVRSFYTDPQFFHDVEARIANARAERSKTLTGSARNLLQTWVI